MSSNLKISAKIKRLVFERAKHCCEYCMCPAAFSNDTLSVDHILAKAKGGLNLLINLALACQACNGHKFTKLKAIDPLTGAFVDLFNPRTQAWTEHFSWSGDYLFIIGSTTTGRATVEALKLNWGGLVNMRSAMLLLGVHPPKHSLK